MIHQNYKINNKKQIENVLKKMFVDKHALVNNGYSSYNTVVDYANLKVFDKVINKFIELAGKDFNVIDFWINVYFKNGYVKKHTHTPDIKKLKNIPIQTGVYYFKKPKNSGNIVVDNKVIKIKQSDIILFDGNLMHYSERNKSNLPRIIFSINLMKGIKKIWNPQTKQYTFKTKDEF